MIVPPLAVLHAHPPADVGVERFVRQRQRVQRDFGFGEWQRCQDLIAKRLRWNRSERAYAGGLTIAFVGREEERSLPDDRSTERAAELIKFHGGCGHRGGEERVARQEFCPLIVFECRAMERVSARPADHVHLAANDSAVLCRQNALDDLNLLDGLDADDIDLILSAVLCQGAPFRVGIGLGTVYRNARAACANTVEPNAVEDGSWISAGRQAQQALNIAAR